MPPASKRFWARLQELGCTGLSRLETSNDYSPPLPLGQAELSKLEREFGITLPGDYREFLLEVGGVFFRGTNVVPLEVRKDFGNVEHVTTLFGSDREQDSLQENIETYVGRIPKNLIPIGDDPYGNLHCVGVGGKENGKIYFWNHEGPGDEDDPRGITLVAASFEDFIARLVKAAE